MDIFKCKKCGSEDYKLIEKGTATGLYCADCGFWHKWVAKKELYRYKAFLANQQKELSTAEKLLYIVEKGAEIYTVLDSETHEIAYREIALGEETIGEFNIQNKASLAEAINTAFKAVKEQSDA